MFTLSWLGGFLVSALSAFRLGVVLSDPLTGFRVYRRSRLSDQCKQALLEGPPRHRLRSRACSFAMEWK